MKEPELRKAAMCAVCRKPFGNAGTPFFWRVSIQRFVINPDALKRQHGLGMMLPPALAMVMGPNEDLAQTFGEPAEFTVCDSCSDIQLPCVGNLTAEQET